jgi:hypothetical protein
LHKPKWNHGPELCSEFWSQDKSDHSHSSKTLIKIILFNHLLHLARGYGYQHQVQDASQYTNTAHHVEGGSAKMSKPFTYMYTKICNTITTTILEQYNCHY